LRPEAPGSGPGIRPPRGPGGPTLTFVLPAIGKKKGQKYIGTWKMEPLTLAVLRAMVPPGVRVTFFDDRLERVDTDRPTDAVLIPVETYTARRAYALAGRFRQRGARVVLGGYHVTLQPDEAAQHADALVLGNAEAVLPTLLDDLWGGRLQPRYHGEVGYSRVPPDTSLYAGKHYLPVSLVETGRGCPHRCEFCAIAGYYGRHYHPRPLADILRDLQSARHRRLFLVDDNLVADREHALELFRRMKPLGLAWAGQGTLSVGRDPELVQAMVESGCRLLLVGFESLQDENLRQMDKHVNRLRQDRDELVGALHGAGLHLYATFVFGYDADTPETVRGALDFALRHRFFTAAFNHLLPFPGTALHDRLQQEGRLRYDRWWLDPDYRYGDLAFEPRGCSAGELSRACRDARRAFSSPRNLLHRASRVRWSDWPLFWAMNLPLGREVDQKMAVPLGENLDELPK